MKYYEEKEDDYSNAARKALVPLHLKFSNIKVIDVVLFNFDNRLKLDF